MKHKVSRPSVPVPHELLIEISEHPEHFSLERTQSQARRMAAVFEAGAAALRAQERDRERQATYLAWAQEPERLEAMAEMRDAMLEDGGLLGRFAPASAPSPVEAESEPA